ncbi:MAG: DUF1761 domain-containing protein [Patescibacteria group bacterium]
MDVPIYYLAVFLAAVSSLAVGAAWYSEALFGKPWKKALGVKEGGDKSELGMAIGGSFVLALVTAYVLAHTIEFSHNYFHYSYLQTGLSTAFFLWLGMQMTSAVTHSLFEGSSKVVLKIRLGHDLVSLLLMGLIIALVR